MKKLLITLLLCLPVLAQADILVVAASQSPVTKLNKADVAQIFTGQKRAVDGNRILPLDLPHQSEVRTEFYLNIVGKNRNQMRAYWAKMIFTGKGQLPLETDGAFDMVSMLESSPEMIGYIDSANLTDKLKVLYTLKEGQ